MKIMIFKKLTTTTTISIRQIHPLTLPPLPPPSAPPIAFEK